MTCERNLKTWSRYRMFDYKKKLQQSRNENRKGLLYRNYALFLRVAKKLR